MVISTHHAIMGGHFGIAKTYDAISQRFYFPRMKKTIERYIKMCVQCQHNKAKKDKLLDY